MCPWQVTNVVPLSLPLTWQVTPSSLAFIDLNEAASTRAWASQAGQESNVIWSTSLAARACKYF